MSLTGNGSDSSATVLVTLLIWFVAVIASVSTCIVTLLAKRLLMERRIIATAKRTPDFHLEKFIG
jgi:hypothetical protein